MSRALPDGLAELVPHIPAAGENPFATAVRHPATPVVLEAIDTGDRYREQPASVLCPGCGTVCTRYRDGVPLRVARFEQSCGQCETTLQRWAAVAVGTAHERAPGQAALREVVTDYWERHLWAGIVTGETAPRTREYTDLYTAQATAFGWDWTVTCPLCRRPVAAVERERLEYHHWRRDPDQGVCLCRTCHDALSGQHSDTDLDWTAQELGLRDKHDLQLTRLALREQAVQARGSLSALVEQLHERYNLVQSPAHVFALLSQTLADETIIEHVRDEHLLAEVTD